MNNKELYYDLMIAIDEGDIDYLQRNKLRYKKIETDLNRLDEIDKVMFINNQKMQKQDEILRIIKEKNVNIHGIINAPTLEYYNDHCQLRHSEDLTQAEFDLLKEFFK